MCWFNILNILLSPWIRIRQILIWIQKAPESGSETLPEALYIIWTSTGRLKIFLTFWLKVTARYRYLGNYMILPGLRIQIPNTGICLQIILLDPRKKLKCQTWRMVFWKNCCRILVDCIKPLLRIEIKMFRIQIRLQSLPIRIRILPRLKKWAHTTKFSHIF